MNAYTLLTHTPTRAHTYSHTRTLHRPIPVPKSFLPAFLASRTQRIVLRAQFDEQARIVLDLLVQQSQQQLHLLFLEILGALSLAAFNVLNVIQRQQVGLAQSENKANQSKEGEYNHAACWAVEVSH